MTNKRQHERIEIAIKVTLTQGGREIVAETKNVSAGGMLITGGTELAYGTAVRVRTTLPIPPNGHELDVAATVRWNQGGAIGVQFEALRAKETWALNQLVKMLADKPA